MSLAVRREGEVAGSAVDATTWYADTDTDSYGDAGADFVSCTQPSGYVADSTDCDDSLSTVNPGLSETCFDGLDNDCNDFYEDTCYTNDGGELLISEIFYAADSSTTAWFEVSNEIRQAFVTVARRETDLGVAWSQRRDMGQRICRVDDPISQSVGPSTSFARSENSVFCFNRDIPAVQIASARDPPSVGLANASNLVLISSRPIGASGPPRALTSPETIFRPSVKVIVMSDQRPSGNRTEWRGSSHTLIFSTIAAISGSFRA